MRVGPGLSAVLVALIVSSAANAHSIRIECKKLDGENVVCRSLFTDGEVARNMLVQLFDDEDKVLATGRTDNQGKYAFKAPAPEYNVVVEANKSGSIEF